eukprot:11196387-Lingulodinium_polyedra.AAC.1
MTGQEPVVYILRNTRAFDFQVAPSLGHPRDLPGGVDKLSQVTYAIAGVRAFAPQGSLAISVFSA